jgi:hypothetical protein
MEQFEGLLAGRRTVTKRVSVIWFACIWSIWKATNGKLFQNKEVCVDKMFEEVKVASWNWLHIKSNIRSCGRFAVLVRSLRRGSVCGVFLLLSAMAS